MFQDGLNGPQSALCLVVDIFKEMHYFLLDLPFLNLINF